MKSALVLFAAVAALGLAGCDDKRETETKTETKTSTTVPKESTFAVPKEAETTKSTVTTTK